MKGIGQWAIAYRSLIERKQLKDLLMSDSPATTLDVMYK
jgi:hypothetical protein